MTPQARDEAWLVDGFPPPPAMRALMPLLSRVPLSVASTLLAGLAIGDGALRRRRYARAVDWATTRGDRGVRAHVRALRVLATHGHFLALEAMLGTRTLEALRASTDVVGRERLSAGGIALGWHLGPPRTWLTLRAHGVPVVATTRRMPVEGTALAAWIADGSVVHVPLGEAAGRVDGLYRLRKVLAASGLVYLQADGPSGTELCRLDVPGGPIVRTGWFRLRRMLACPVYPVLAERRGGRTTLVVHPALPAVVDDEAADLEACRRSLSQLVGQFVAEHPDQCRYLAFPDW